MPNKNRTASQWFALMRSSNIQPAEKKAFYVWLSDPENQAHYAAMDDVWAAYDELADDAQIKATRKSYRRGRRRKIYAGLVAVAAMLAVFFITQIEPVQDNLYQTEIGEQERIILADGSVLHLNTATRIIVDYTEKFRRIELQQGEILVTVEPDPARPLIVVAGNTLSRAIGTEFNVYRPLDGSVEVTVSHGIVEVTRTEETDAAQQYRLIKGETVTLSKEPPEIDTVPLDSISTWRTGQLDFDNITLPEALSEINRYRTKKIYIGDKSLNDLRLSAVLNIQDQAYFAEILEQTFPIVVVPGDGNKVILLARENKK